MSETAVRAVIVGNGEPPSRELLARAMEGERPLLLCADGGANTADAYGHPPDYVVGDLDSVDAGVLERLPRARRIQVADDDNTDLEKVLLHALSLGVRQAELLGFTGRRTDHTLWNLSLLRTFGDRMDLRLVDDHCEIRLIRDEIRFRARLGLKLSLCPLTGPVQGIVTRGLRWPLQNEELAPGARDGISNEVVDNPVEIRVGHGDLLLCVQREGGQARIELV